MKRICSSLRLRSICAIPIRSHSRRSSRSFQQIDGRIGRRAVAVFHLGAHFGQRGFTRRACDLLVEPQPLVFFRHIALVDAQRNTKIELRGRPLLAAFALHLLHGGFKHRGVQLETHGFNMSALLAAQHVARAAQLEVERGNLEARAQVAELLERSESSARNLGQLVLRRDE